MLNVFAPSPPVPTTSTRSVARRMHGQHVRAHRLGAAGDLVGGLALEPKRNEEPADLAGVASPDMIVFITSRACSRGEVLAVEQLCDRLLHHVALQEVPRDVGPGRRQHRLRVELHAVDRELAVAHGHHLAVGGGRGDLEAVRDRRRGERVVAARREVLRQAGEQAAPVVVDGGRLAVDERLRRARPRRRTRRRSPGGRGRRRAPARGRRVAARSPSRRPRPPAAPARARRRDGTAPAPRPRRP